MPFSEYQDRALLRPGGRLATLTAFGYDADTNR
jgi:hypothetical protein